MKLEKRRYGWEVKGGVFQGKMSVFGLQKEVVVLAEGRFEIRLTVAGQI